MENEAPLTKLSIVDTDTDALKSYDKAMAIDIMTLEEKLENMQSALSKKRKLRTDIRCELTFRAVEKVQIKTKMDIGDAPTDAKLRLLGTLVRTYIYEQYAEFYGGGLGVSETYYPDTVCIKFGRNGSRFIRVESDGTAARETWETHTVNVLDDHPRTWRL